MLFNSLISLLFSNSVTLRRDLSIFFNRIAILALTYSILHHILSLVIFTSKGISLHGGLLHITNITQIFHVFLFVLCILILLLTSFYPAEQSGKSLMWGKLSNSGEALKLLIPSYSRKTVSG